MRFEICPKKVLKFICCIILILLVINLFANVFTHYFYLGDFNDLAFNMLQMFNFNTEKNIPTLFSTILLMLASALLAFIGIENKQLKQSFLPWLMFSLGFLFLTVDELSSLHERLTPYFRSHFQATGLLYYSWVIPYGIATFLIGLGSLRFLARLPADTKKLFICSGLIFVSGAIGVEMISGMYAQEHGEFNMFYAFLYTIEERLEMLGVAIFIYALLTYIAKNFKSPTFKIAN